MAKKGKDNKKEEQEKKKKNPQPPKKKRKVGRPKKRGRKKKYYKKKKKKKKSVHSNKGFGSNSSYNRVRALLWKTHKDDFASYRDFISNRVDEEGKKIQGTSIVSQVYSECKSIQCTDDDILTIYKQFGAQERGEMPVLPSDYYEPRPYYQLLTEDLWDGIEHRIWIFSPMLLPPPATFLGVLGEDKCVDKNGKPLDKPLKDCDPKKGERIINGKKTLFTPFVNYCNQFQQQGIYTTSDTVPHIKFIGKSEDEPDPYWNEELNRWEVQIVPCNPPPPLDNGEINDFDFDPDELDHIIPEDYEPVEPSEVVEEVEEPKDLDKVKADEIKKTAELERAEISKSAKQERLIKKKADIREDIKLYKDIGDKKEMAKAVKKLKEVTKQIDKLD
jgi:hypothetical protein